MSKYLPDWAYDVDNCTKYHTPSGHCGYSPSCDPIDININVNCCCPEPPTPGGEQCCCQQGIFEALEFLRTNYPNVTITLRGQRPGLGNQSNNALGTGTITELTEDIVRLSGTPSRVISLCAIWVIQVNSEEIELTMEACGTTDTNCCCNPGLSERLNTRVSTTETTTIALDDQNTSTNDTTGFVRLVCDDVVWLLVCSGSSDVCRYVVVPLCRIAWIEPISIETV